MDRDGQLVDRVQRLERLSWKSITIASEVWEKFDSREQLSYIEERIRTLAYLEAMPAKK